MVQQLNYKWGWVFIQLNCSSWTIWVFKHMDETILTCINKKPSLVGWKVNKEITGFFLKLWHYFLNNELFRVEIFLIRFTAWIYPLSLQKALHLKEIKWVQNDKIIYPLFFLISWNTTNARPYFVCMFVFLFRSLLKSCNYALKKDVIIFLKFR